MKGFVGVQVIIGALFMFVVLSAVAGLFTTLLSSSEVMALNSVERTLLSLVLPALILAIFGSIFYYMKPQAGY